MSLEVLYVSSSMGLGHVNRDLAVAAALRRRRPDADVAWLAAEPAASVLRRAGERLHPGAAGYRSDTDVANRVAGEGQLSLTRYATSVAAPWARNALWVRRILSRERFDVLVADEAYELMIAHIVRLLRPPPPFLMMYDFVGLDAMTPRGQDHLGAWVWNLVWSRDRWILPSAGRRAVFIGEPEDVAETAFGRFLPPRREHALRGYDFVGYVLPFDPAALRDRDRLRAELGYGARPLVVCAVGGLAVGRQLLELCARAHPLLAPRVDVHMVLVCGPGIAPESVAAPPGVDVRGYVPDLYRHLAASDLAVVQAGGTTTLELTALRRPFLYFPLEGQSEQQLTVAGRLRRHHAGTRMPATTTPAQLADAIAAHLGAPVDVPDIPTDGADRIAAHILDLAATVPRGTSTPARNVA